MNKWGAGDLADFDSINRELDKVIAKLEKIGGGLESGMQGIQGEAAKLEESSKALNTTTAAGREEMQKAAKQADALTASYQAQAKKLLEHQIEVEELTHLKRLLAAEAKNQVKANASEEGSYNKLAAQYNLNKIRLNAMGIAQREGTADGRELVKVTNEMYQEMKRLQGQTGKNTLDVGNYGKALVGAAQNLGEMRKELKELRNTSFVGKSGEEIDELNRRIGELRDNIGDLTAVQDAYGKETGVLVAGSLQFFAAGIEGIVAGTKLLGIQSPILDKLQNSVVELIAVSQALGTIEDVLQKKTLQATAARLQSIAINARDTVTKWANNVATVAAARAEDAKAVATTRGSIITRAAAAVQWLWNAALAANPIGLVVVAVAALAAGMIYLNSRMGESADLTASLNSELERMRELSEQNERLRKFEIELAQERGKVGSEQTKLEIKQTGDRIAEKEKELATLRKYGTLTDEQAERYKALTFELIDLDKQKIIQRERLQKQTADEADARAKEAEKAMKDAAQKAEAAKRERERIAKDNEAKLKARQDAALKEIETEKNYQLAKFDVETNYGNQSTEYQRQRAIERFNLEQTLNKALLDEQLKFHRISQKEYDTALLNQQVSLNEFTAKIQAERRDEAPARLPGIDLSKKAQDAILKDVTKKIEVIAQRAREQWEKEAARQPATSFLGRLLGLDKAQEDAAKTALNYSISQVGEYTAAVQRAADAKVQASNTAVQAAENEYNRQTALAIAGEANKSQTAEKALNEAKKRQADALEYQKKIQRQQILLDSAAQASNLILAVSNVYKVLSAFGPAGTLLAVAASGLMIGSFLAAKVKAIAVTKQEFAEGGWGEIGGGTHANGNDTNLGFKTKSGKQAHAQRGELFGVIRHEKAKRYKPVFGAIVDAMNKGKFEEQFNNVTRAGDTLKANLSMDTSKMEGYLGSIDRQLQSANSGEGDFFQVLPDGSTVAKRGNWTVTNIRGTGKNTLINPGEHPQI